MWVEGVDHSPWSPSVSALTLARPPGTANQSLTFAEGIGCCLSEELDHIHSFRKNKNIWFLPIGYCVTWGLSLPISGPQHLPGLKLHDLLEPFRLKQLMENHKDPRAPPSTSPSLLPHLEKPVAKMWTLLFNLYPSMARRSLRTSFLFSQ